MTASNIIKRILGGIMMATALVIMIGSAVGAFRVGDAIASMTTSIENTLQFAGSSLATANDTIALTQNTIRDVGNGLTTASSATANLSGAIADSRPLLTNVGVLVTEDLPKNLEAVQSALPNVVQVAGVIDQTLTTLSNIGIDRTIDLPFGQSIPIQWDLGIDYDPEVPFDQTLRAFDDTLAGLPESLRALEEDLTVTTDNLGILSDNLQTISADLDVINTGVADLVPLLDQYTAIIADLEASISSAQERIPAQLDTVRLGVVLGLVLLALSQLAGLYLGWELLSGQRDRAAMVTPASEVVSEKQ